MNVGPTHGFPRLNLPEADLAISTNSGKWYVFDPIRKKDLLLTPEEWVRQHLIHYFVSTKNYPRSLFVLERGLAYNQLAKRLDILVVDRTGSPFLLVECKAPDVVLSQRTLEQVCTYNQRIQSPNLAISNGIKHVVLAFSPDSQTYVPKSSFPDFG
ncbi:type I restriction enzyme HsdR N-terminal domain-containing protein [Lunatimonas lonarensis]|uniref:type I restriction enzyme HsdR N-terminal domain-containing protein n=1 Tax=Lunatimonas lonarensis TaxID=1232681 RepID=UPI0005609A70|nr:type I restriction enzyme HsdR N-terminal domain-containing protein [Lunatimonas lonarensis]